MMGRRQHHSMAIVLWVLAVCFVFKILLSAYFPLTGDEAYYQIWGERFAWGYYDHTPFIGWFLHPFLMISHSMVMLRLPATLVTSIIGFLIFLLLRPYDDRKAMLISVLFFISPLNLLGVLMTTDIPLILFSFLSGLFLFLAIKHEENLWFYFLSGICLGLAFFSKYFAVLLALSYFVYFLISAKCWKRTIGFVIVFLCVLPFGLENLYWNYTHGWANILFNVYHRNEGIRFSWETMLVYIFIIFYIITPPLFYYFCKHSKNLFKSPEQREFRILTVSLFAPLFFFLVLSAFKSIGLHWPLSFIPFAYLLVILYLSEKEIIRSIQVMAWLTAIHVILVAILIVMPVTYWQHFGIQGSQYANLVFALKHPQIRKTLDQYSQDYVIASPSYAKADLMSVDSRVDSPTFGAGSVHGREGDFMTNYHHYTDRNFVIFLTDKPDLSRFQPYFKILKEESFIQFGAKFYLLFGYHFNYSQYQKNVLTEINRRFWQVPSYLPYTQVFYCTKYFNHCPSRPIK